MGDKEDIQIDTRNLNNKIKILLSQIILYDIKVEINEHKGEYTLASERMKLIIRINEKWIGYDLEINKSVLGKVISTFSDTDNYPIQGEYAKIALEKFNEVFHCLRAVLDNEIYIGKDGKKLYLALPVNNNEFKVIMHTGFFSRVDYSASKEEIEKDPRLQRLFGSTSQE